MKTKTHNGGGRTALGPTDPNFSGYATEVVSLADIEIDPQYQRKRSDAKIKKLVANFDPRKVVPPIISHRVDPNGTDRWFCVEGQHTVEVLQAMGYNQWHCVVHDDLSLSEEANMWTGINTSRTKPTTRDVYQALFTEGHKETLKIEKMLNRHGLSGINNSGHTVLKAIGAPPEIVKKYGWEVLDETLDLCTRTWRRAQIRRYTLLAVARLIATYGSALDWDHFEKRFSTQDPSDLESVAKFNNRQNHWLTIPTALARELAHQYNYWKRGRRLDLPLLGTEDDEAEEAAEATA